MSVSSGVGVPPEGVVRMQPAHVDGVVRIHAESFPAYRSTLYGPAFLRLLYGEFCRSAACESFVHLGGSSAVDGFVCGVRDYKTFYADLLRHNLVFLAWVLAGALLKRPRLAVGILRRGAAVVTTAISPRHTTPGGLKELEFLHTRRYANLVSIAVAPAARGSPAGLLLVRAFAEELTRKGYQHCLLDTERDNVAANKFFEKAGFRFVMSRTLHESDRVGNVYVMDL